MEELFIIKFKTRKSLLIRQRFFKDGHTCIQRIRDIEDLEYGLGNTLVVTYANNTKTLEDLLKDVFVGQEFEVISINI